MVLPWVSVASIAGSFFYPGACGFQPLGQRSHEILLWRWFPSERALSQARTLDWQAGLRLHEFLVMKVSPSVSDAMIALLIRAPERVQEARRGGDRIIAKGLPCSDPA